MSLARTGRICAIVAFLFVIGAYTKPAAAQSGQLKGKVVDAQNKPVEGAKILMEALDTGRKFETKSDRKGEFVQIGLPPGNYKVTASKETLSQSFPVRVGLDQKEVNFVLKPGGDPASMSAEDVKKEAARRENIKTLFAEGATLTNEGKYDEAITKFNAVIAEIPKCFDCYNNLGTIYVRKQEWDKAEEAFKKVLELSPDNAEAYSGLATVYNAQKKFKEAQAMSAEAVKRLGTATGGGNATAYYNAAVTAWNSNDFPKANELLQQALKTDPNHADSHFMLGKVLINLGKLGEAATEFETYLKLAPSGPNAKEAQTTFEALKAYRK